MTDWSALQRGVAGARRRFLGLLNDPATVQRRQLAGILQANAASEVGRKYRFATIRSEAEFRDIVPVQRYEDVHESMERIAGGSPGVLTVAPVVAFELTGGSTGAPQAFGGGADDSPARNSGAKWIPLTEPALHSIQRAVRVWLDDLITARPGMVGGRMYWPVSPVGRGPSTTRAGIPIGMPNDAAYLGPGLQAAIAPLLVSALDSELTFISVWSPTFLLELWRDQEAAPKSLWPRLDTISCWTSAASARFASQLRRLAPLVYIQGKGLLATEGVVTIPLEGQAHPVLAIESNFYEFLDSAGNCKCAWELDQGSEYDVLLTTHGGLYRYALGDRVRVAGFAGGTPLLEFLGRGAMASDLVGEKLSDPFVTACLTGLNGFAMIAPALEPHPHYVLFVDEQEHAQSLGQRVEQRLRENPQYAYARDRSQLSPLEVVLVDRPMDRYLAHCVASGQRLGDIKPVSLSNRADWSEIFANPI
ncbi:MAG: GH3 auxin-responsive promoter family protein [Bryobacteraceae bacterium]